MKEMVLKRVLLKISSIGQAEVSPRAVWIGALVASIVNLGILLWYQTKLGGDFPFQDEWGYVDRLVHLKSVGMFHYLFDRYQVYFMPGTFAIWYLFYHLFHLDIMAIRYSGATVTAGVAFLLCAITIGRCTRFDVWNLILIASLPFVVCSLSHWATYNQSIESVIEPFLFGCVLVACWAGQKMADHNGDPWRNLLWLMAAVLSTLLAVSMYAPGLSVLVAIAVARVLLFRKIDVFSIGLVLIGVGIGISYIILGGGSGHHIQLSEVHLVSVVNEWIVLFGNALLTNPLPVRARWIVGALIILTLLVSTVRFLSLPIDRRLMCFIPLVLTIYTFGVSLEITWAYHSPYFGTAPRYAIHMVGGPVATLLWAILLPRGTRLKFYDSAIAVVVLMCVSVSIVSTSILLPYFHNDFSRIRAELLTVNAPITEAQRKKIQVNPPLKEMVYPDLQFLRKHRLALFRKGSSHAE